MKDPRQRLMETFGVERLPNALFCHFKYGLRFSLADEAFDRSTPIPRLLQGIDRARAISRTLFQNSSSVSALFSYVRSTSEHPSYDETNEYWTSLGLCCSLGRPSPCEVNVDGSTGFAEYLYCVDLPALLPGGDMVLWSALTSEVEFSRMGVAFTVKHGGEYYLVDFSRAVILHVYDDRGMDVVSMSPEPLKAIYWRYAEWLLDSDRPRMDATFGPALDGD
jgi:hypothetical protein